MVALSVPGGPGPAASFDEQVTATLEALRQSKPTEDPSVLAGYNKQMDEAWKLYLSDLDRAVPILRRELDQELHQSTPAPLVLLDIGYFLHLKGAPPARGLGLRALYALDPDRDVLRANFRELFLFAHWVSEERAPGILPFLTRAFLRGRETMVRIGPDLELGPTLQCAFVFGVHGAGAEAHLRALLVDPALRDRVLEVLIWMGTARSVPAVVDVLRTRPGFETFGRAVTFLMTTGGPAGRAALLDLDSSVLDEASRVWYASVRSQIEATSFTSLKAAFSGFPHGPALDDEALEQRLGALYDDYGEMVDTDPSAVLGSSLPTDELRRRLEAIRARAFHRVSSQALRDVRVLNGLLNALRYR